MGSGAKGQWFKCKEDAKPHATMPTTTTITERTPKDMPCNFLFCGELQLLRIRRVVYSAKERAPHRLDRQREQLFIAGSSKTELSLDSALELTLLANYSCISSPPVLQSCPHPVFVPFDPPSSSRHSWKPVGWTHIKGEMLEVQYRRYLGTQCICRQSSGDSLFAIRSFTLPQVLPFHKPSNPAGFDIDFVHPAAVLVYLYLYLYLCRALLSQTTPTRLDSAVSSC